MNRRSEGRDRADQAVAVLVREWRELRLAAGLSQRTVARQLGIARSTFSDLERGARGDIGLRRAVTLTTLLGARLAIQVFPGGLPVRDAGHLALLARFDARVPALWRVRHETPVGMSSDGRAWDRRLDGPVSIGLEAETRLRDIQALQRRIQLKQAESGVQRVILLVAGSRHNRALVSQLLPELRPTFPLSSAETLRALAGGRDPGANGLVLL